MLNNEMKELGSKRSAIRELFEIATAKKQLLGPDKAYDFSIGNPSVPVPKYVSDTLKKLIDENDSQEIHGYTTAAGDEKARNAIASYLNRKYAPTHGGIISAKYMYLTVGASAALTIILNAICNKGDEVIVIKPYFPEYSVFIKSAKAKMVAVKTDKNFIPDFDDLKKKISEKTKAVIIDSPNNPTGVVYPPEVIDRIGSVLEQKQIEYGHDIYLIADEPYREVIFDESKYTFVPNRYRNTIVIYSYSKSLSLPGERIGYIALARFMNHIDDVYASILGAGRSLGFVCAPSLLQKALPYLQGTLVDINEYKKNCDDLRTILDEIGYEYIEPQGAFYLFVKSLEKDAVKFSLKASEYNLFIVPSDSFGVKGYVRIAYCVSNQTIKNSKEAFKALYDYYKEK